MALRVKQLSLAPWGCFEDLQLEFGSAGVVDLVVGSNAAGKSTATRGAVSLVFGIPVRPVDAHTFPYQDLRIGARVHVGEREVDLIRRKGRTGTLATPEGTLLPEDTFAAALNGLNRDVFEALFVIDNPTLQRGGAELLQGRGEIGASLFAAAAGIATLHRTVERLETEAKNQFNPGGRKDPVHNALREVRDAEKRLREGTLRPRKHREMERALEGLERECDQLSGEIAALEAESRELTRLRKVSPLIHRHMELAAELAELGDTPELDEQAGARRAAAQAHWQSAQAQRDSARESVEQLNERIKLLSVNAELELRAEEIRAAHAGISATKKAAADRPKLERELIEAEDRLRTAAEAAGTTPEMMESLTRPEPARRGLDETLRLHSQLVERSRAGAAAKDAAAGDLREAEALFAQLSPPDDPAPLTAATRAALKSGPIERQALESRTEAKRVRGEAEARLARMRHAPASLDQLETLVAPSREEVARALAREKASEQAARDIETTRVRLETDAAELAEQKDELEIGGLAPSRADLEAARVRRDGTWNLLRTALADGAAPEAGTASDFEQQVAEADAVADVQLAGATRTERVAKLEAAARKLDREREALAQREAELEQCQREERRSWSEVWPPTVATPEVHEANAWLDQRDEILGLMTSARSKAGEAGAMEEQAQRHRQALRERIESVDISPVAGTTLSELLEVADTATVRVETEKRGYDEARRSLSETRAALDRAEREVADVSSLREDWQSTWPAVLEAAGLPAATSPDGAPEIARAIDVGLDQIVRIAERKRRMAGIDRDRTAYEQQVRDLTGAVAPDLERVEPERGATDLMRRLRENDAAATQRAGLTEVRDRAQEEFQSAQTEFDKACHDLDVMLTAAGCDDVAQLPTVEARAARARELRKELRGAERHVVELGEAGFTELTAEVEGFDLSAASMRIVEADEEASDLGLRRDKLKKEIGGRESELRNAETDLAAVEAAEEIELARTELEKAGREYVKTKLAAVVVHRAMSRYRRLHENPLLERANQLFARFTLGSFVELFVDHDERLGAILVGRQRDRQLKRVEQMSSGTREQLFLALRIAAIERYVATAGPVPVIFDDAFLESDETRSEKIFEALGELAQLTQVLVLTHRRQQATLGVRTLGDRVAIVELPDAAPVLRAAAQSAA